MTDDSRVRRFGSYALRGVRIDHGEGKGAPVLTEKGSISVAAKHPQAAARLKALRRRRDELAAAAAPEPRVAKAARAPRDTGTQTADTRPSRIYAGHED